MRKIDIVFKNEAHYWLKGVYLIRFGRMFYVGKALIIGERMLDHQRNINKGLSQFSSLENAISKESELNIFKSYSRICRYLHENPSIKTGQVEVLERQVCSKMLYHSENFYLSEFVGNPDCYNISAKGAKPRADEDNLWTVSGDEKRLAFYDPRATSFVVSNRSSRAANKDTLAKLQEYKQTKSYKQSSVLLEAYWLRKPCISIEERKHINEYITKKYQAI